MSHRQIPSRCPDAPQAPPETDSTEELLIKDSEGPAPEPFGSGDRFYSDLLKLVLRFFLICCSLALLVICLWQFSGRGPLDKWQQRCLNTLSILLTGIASLGLGSLVGYLGSMLRWPLLARTMYKMQDIDLILGMAPPTGSLRLIWRHLWKDGTSRTTRIVAAYLLINIFGRLSVAVFGLTYNTMDRTGIEYPILSTNWDSVSWAGYSNASAIYDLGAAEDYWNSVWNGVRKYAKKPKWMDDMAQSEHFPLFGEFPFTTANSSDLLSELRIENSTLEEPVGPNTVEYSYQLKDFHEGYAIPSNHTVHSTVNCSFVEVSKQGQYWRWNNWDRTGPLDWRKESDDVLSQVLVASKDAYHEYSVGYPHWASFAYTNHEPSHVYLVCPEFAWECSPTLTETVANQSSQFHQGLFNSARLYALPAAGVLGRLRMGNFAEGPDFDYAVFVNQLPTTWRGPNALDGLRMICDMGNFTMPLDKIRWNTYTLWVSGLVARLPILAIAYENAARQQYTRDTHSNRTAGTAYLHTTLEVNWNRVTLTAVSIMVGQILVILIVIYYCNGVYTRDDSHLATAELLKTVITRFDGGKLMTGEELAVSLDRALGVSVSYGTREGQDGGPPEVDLESGLDSNFPPFPHKRRFWRKTNQRLPEVQ
ncbi:hypothetical protein B9Z19DRAFT_1038365 [Tuber borchii]|uniref:Uncharacterized protein n=1 Tax=Tuber borchii TaxID=42251 RepID=A0A2T7A7W0_TUBBO|nr:hypothetical protein B9Z19DRAFT_1038365 [Tuber borchii]